MKFFIENTIIKTYYNLIFYCS